MFAICNMERMPLARWFLILLVTSSIEVSAPNPGQCPPISDRSGGICLEECYSDSSCESYQKCCSNGCGHLCVDTRPRMGHLPRGRCPPFVGDSIGICLDECSASNDHCEEGKICCSNGCGHVCTTPMVEKEGRCPAFEKLQHVVGVCSEECRADSDCEDAKKCCSNGCGHVCVDSNQPTVGMCPNVTGDSISTSGVCTRNCSSDDDCVGEQVCCNNGCGQVCVNLAQPKPGQCPDVALGSSMGICIEDCNSDESCPGELKCCSNGCGHGCVMPDQSKPGYCSEIPLDSLGICSEDCSSDANCTGEQKCCSNGCGHTCEEPVWYICPAVAKGTVGICSDGCASDNDCRGKQMCCSNGCGRDCVDPVLKDTPRPTGRDCPMVNDGTMGICVEECRSDEDCTNASQRCCSTGCGHVCMDTGSKTQQYLGCRLGENFYSDGDSVHTSDECKTCICTAGDVVCKIMEKCRGEGTFSMAIVTPIMCTVAGIVISLLCVVVLVKYYISRMVPKKRPYKLMHEVPEFEPIHRDVL